MSKSTHKFGHRVLAGFLSLICLFSLVLDSAPKAFADPDPDPSHAENIELYFTDEPSENIVVTNGAKTIDYTIPSSEQIVNIKLHISLNKKYVDGQLQIAIPAHGFKTRDGGDFSMANKSAFLNQISGNSILKVFSDNSNLEGEDGVIILTNNAVTAPQIDMELSYRINAMKVLDNGAQTFNVKITDTVTGEDRSPESITATFRTHVKNAWLSKYTESNGVKSGCYYKWDDMLESRYKLSELDDPIDEAKFTELCKNYDFIGYRFSCSASRNQPTTLYLEDKPAEGGEVIAVSHVSSSTSYTSGTPLKKETEGPYAGKWKYESTSSSRYEYLIALVQYPKSVAESTDENGDLKPIRNEATVTFVGKDGDTDDVTSDDDAVTSVWQGASAIYHGDIWSVRKKGYDDPAGAINLLRAGKDVTFKYEIAGIGHTYKYGAVDGFQYNNGPYWMEVVDDVLYVNGLGAGGTENARLQPDDFHFTSFTMDVKHKDVTAVALDGNVKTSTDRPISEREPVEVYVMTEDNTTEWQLDQKVSLPYISNYGSVSTSGYVDENGNSTFTLKHDKVCRIKFVYKGANGDIELTSYVYGVLKGTGSTVKKVLENIDKENLDGFQLFNWDGQMGYDKNGVWENPTDGVSNGASITGATAWMRDDLLTFDAQNYAGHSYENGNPSNTRVATRLPAQNKLTALSSQSGAGKESNGITHKDKRIYGEYYIAAVTGKAGTADELKELINLGIIPESKTVVFHELLPIGMSIESVTPTTYNSSVYFGHYSWDKTGSDYPYYAANMTEQTPEITYEVTDNYKGTLRQMVDIKVTYPELPIVRIGLSSSYYSALGSILKIKTRAEYTDLQSTTLDNYMEAQFLDENDKPIELEGEGALPDDGEIYSNVKDRDNKNALSDVDGDNKTANKTVVAADDSDTIDMYYSDANLVKKIKADDYDTYFKDYTQTYAGHNYTYQIKYFAFKGTVKNVVIFDTIEEGYKDEKYLGKPYWKGKLYGVDLTEARDRGFDKIRVFVNTKHYYTDQELENNVATGYPGLRPEDLTAANNWQQVDPDTYTGWADVKTIAFSIGEDVEFGEDENKPKSVNVYLKMTAPDTIHPEQTQTNQVLAYNSPAFYAEKKGTLGWSKDTTTANVVTIGLKSATVDIPAITKKMTGTALPTGFEDTCTFNIKPIGESVVPREYDKDSGVWGNTISSVDIKVNSTSAISTKNGSMFFTEPGEHSYEITEKTGSKGGVTYSKAKYRMDVKITDNRRDIQYDTNTFLNKDVSVYMTHDDDGNELSTPKKVSSIVFNNNYSVVPAVFAVPTAYKKITGAARPEEKEFTFAYSPFAMAGGKTPPTPSIPYVTVKGEGSGSLGNITFTESGNYGFIIYELNSNQKGYTYDTHGFWVRVTVVDDNGKLKVTKSSIDRLDPTVMEPEPAEKIEFTNVYSPHESNAVAFPEVFKQFTGYSRPDDKEFSFTLTAKDGAPLPNKTKVTITGSGKDSFGAVSYSKAGTYVYEITEDDLDPSYTGYTKDNTVYTYTVTVTDKDGVLDATGKLTKDGNDATDVIFTNDYTPASCTFTFPVAVKKINGPERPSEKTFTFELKAAEGTTPPMPTNTVTAVVGEGPAATFGEITYDQAGTYLYDIFEQDLDDSYVGYTKDEAVYRLDVTVKDVDGKFAAGYKLTKNGEETNELTFVNTYTPKAVETVLEIEKQVKGDVPQTKENFTFVLEYEDGAPVPLDVKLTILGQGKGNFGKWTYTQAGTYVYKVRETAGSNKEYEYDKTVYIITDIVTDNDGVLELSRKISAGENDAESVVFVNNYKKEKPKNDKPKDNPPSTPPSTPPQTGNTHSASTCFGAVIVLAAALCIAKRYNDKNEDSANE